MALGNSLGHQGAGDGERTSESDTAGGRDAVGRATVDNGGSLGAVGGVVGDGLSNNTSEGTSGHGKSGSDGETHFDLMGWVIE